MTTSRLARLFTVGVVLTALVAVVIYAGDHHYAPGPQGPVHTLEDDLGAGPLTALVALTVLACLPGRAWVSLSRDGVILALATFVVVVVVTHPHLVYTDFSDESQTRTPFIALAVVVALRVVIGLVQLRAVFRALLARRRVPRARALPAR